MPKLMLLSLFKDVDISLVSLLYAYMNSIVWLIEEFVCGIRLVFVFYWN